ncbi:MAG: hypothetical protein GXO90_00830 [FCB group bacterium]|nr:hypothetical protein [FCB group bacterium]
MSKISPWGLALIFILLSACNDAPATQWAYSAFDSTGVKVLSGWIELNPQPGDTLTGNWKFDPVGNPSNLGPQTGTGTYQGTQTGLNIQLELNPSVVDDNVGLTGQIIGNNWSGTWVYSGFPGIINHGTFIANR